MFNIINKTAININVNHSSTAEEGEDSYYAVNVVFDNVSIYNNSFSSDKTITIPSDSTYNELTGEFNYGQYKVEISSVNSNIQTSLLIMNKLIEKLKY